MMRKESIRIEIPYEADRAPSLWSNKEERLAIDLVLELSRRFGLSQPHDVASVLKVSYAEAERLLGLATATPQSV